MARNSSSGRWHPRSTPTSQHPMKPCVTNEQPELRSCRPLADPLRVASRLITLIALLLFLGAVSPLWRNELSGVERDVQIVFAWFLILPAIMMILGYDLLFRENRRTPVFYLRAFRSDKSARKVRSLLAAAIGPKYRLCGIREPRARAGSFTRRFSGVTTGLRYLGSDQFELEAASRNWIARLLASYAHAPLVIIDVRDVTPNVASEIQLSYIAMGADRCVFLVNKIDEQITLAITEAVGIAPAAAERLQFLAYEGDENTSAEAFLKQACALLAPILGPAQGIHEESLAFARKHVSDQDWKTGFWESDWGQTLLSSIVLFVMWPLLASWIGFLIGLTTWCFAVRAWARVRRRAKLAMKHRKVTGHRVSMIRIYAIIALIVGPLAMSILFSVAFVAFFRARELARENQEAANHGKIQNIPVPQPLSEQFPDE